MKMDILKLNSRGDDVVLWQNFLIGQGFYMGIASGLYDTETKSATILFQKRYHLDADGVVGKDTHEQAEKLGFHFPYEDEENPNEHSPNWPPKPNFASLVTNEQLQQVFGKFSYKSAGSSINPEAITITDNWYRDNIVRINIPQLVGIKDAGNGKNLPFHKLIANRVIDLFQAWEEADLTPLILSWGGSHVARFVRGSRSTLSNHAFGNAFDINVRWNYLGVRPALVGAPGSVRKLVPIANNLGFYWGGHMGRPDGMHFSVAKL